MEILTSRENGYIKEYKKLLINKKYRKNEKKYVLEGIRLIEDAAKENSVIDCVLITEKAMTKYGESLDLLSSKVKKKIYISDELGEYLSDTEGTQGVFAICNILDKTDLSSKIYIGGRYIILDKLQDPGNVGTIIRTADAIGIDAVILCESCDIYSPKVVRSTMGSMFRIPLYDNFKTEQVLTLMREKNVKSYAAVIDDDADNLAEVDFKNGGVVVIGNEGNGLNEKTESLCDRKVTIKMHGNINSLNAAMAAGIIMWEMRR